VTGLLAELKARGFERVEICSLRRRPLDVGCRALMSNLSGQRFPWEDGTRG